MPKDNGARHSHALLSFLLPLELNEDGHPDDIDDGEASDHQSNDDAVPPRQCLPSAISRRRSSRQSRP